MNRPGSPEPVSFRDLDRVRLMLVFEAARPGEVLSLDRDIMPKLQGAQRFMVLRALSRLLSQGILRAAKGADFVGYSMSDYGRRVAGIEINNELMGPDAGTLREVLINLGHTLPAMVTRDSPTNPPAARPPGPSRPGPHIQF